MQALDFIRNSSFVSDDIKEKSTTMKLTNFQRILNDASVREKLGLKWAHSLLWSDYPENEVAKGLCRIINEIAKAEISVKSKYTAQDRVQFMEKISSSLPNFSESSPKVDIWVLSEGDNNESSDDINDDFINRYSDLFENPNEIKDKCLYEITDKMQLKLCE